MSSNGDESQLPPPPPPSSPPPPKKNMGRRKLPMKKMENMANLQVTFSKRRAGLFKKASEFCTLTGSEAGVVVFSPANKPFAFGHPNIYTIMDRYLEDPMNNAGGSAGNAVDPELQANLDELMRMESLLEGEKAKRKELEKARKKMVEEKELVTPSMVGNMNLEELMKLRDSIFKLKSGLEAHVLQKQSTDEADRGKGLKGAEVIQYEKDEMTEDNGGEGGQAAKDGKNAAAEVKVHRLDDGFGRRFF